jgi:hypothetical protein
MGRPSEFSDETAAKILELLAGGTSLRDLCQIEGMPHRSTIHRWVLNHPQFDAAYKLARELGAESLAEQALEAALTVTEETSRAGRLKWDALRWHAGRLSGKWNDKVVVEHTGRDGAPITLQAMPAPMVPSEVAAGIRALLTRAEADMGLPAGSGTDQERLQRLLASGEPMPPDIYEIVHSGDGKDG